MSVKCYRWTLWSLYSLLFYFTAIIYNPLCVCFMEFIFWCQT